MAKSEIYYWILEKENFGGGESPICCGDEMPAGFLDDPRFETFKKEGKISTEKVASKRVLSELEQLREENAKLRKEGGSGITQEQLDAAKAEYAQADLDKLELITEAVKNIQQGDNKEELWKCIKEVKELLK